MNVTVYVVVLPATSDAAVTAAVFEMVPEVNVDPATVVDSIVMPLELLVRIEQLDVVPWPAEHLVSRCYTFKALCKGHLHLDSGSHRV